MRESTKENQHRIAGQLTLDELLAVPDLVAADRKLNERLVPGSHLIQNVELSLTNAALARVSLALKGKALDRQAMESLITECKKLAALGSNLLVTVERRLPLGGVTVKADAGRRQDQPDELLPGELSSRGSRPEHPAVLAVCLQCEGADEVLEFIHWPVKPVAAPKPGAKGMEPGQGIDDDLLPSDRPRMREFSQRREEDFWRNFERLFELTRDACQPYSCILSVQPPDAMEIE